MLTGELIQALPLILVAFVAVLVLFTITFSRSRALPFILTLCGLICSFFSTFPFIRGVFTTGNIRSLLQVDGYTLFFINLILLASTAIAALSYDYLKTHEERSGEYFILLLTATLGAMVLVSSSHFASFFLGLETLSISLYVLIAYPGTGSKPIEAGVKYLILSAFSTAFLLFGMALIYSKTGSMEFSGMDTKIPVIAFDPLVFTGTSMMIVGVGFKLALVPFHMWAPDVYEGAPVPVSALIATVSKGAMFVLLLRYFTETGISQQKYLFIIFSTIAVASMFVGNVLALFQKNIKRLLAYSSIAQFGYIFVAFLSTGTLRVLSSAYYLVTYFAAVIGAFGIVAVLSNRNPETDSIDNYAGLFFVRPWVASAFSLMLLTLAGIPLTMGLIAKFYLFAAGIASNLWLLVIILAVNSVLGLFYYLRVISIMFRKPQEAGPGVTLGLSISSGLVIAVMLILLIWWGVYPAVLINMIEKVLNGT